MLSHDRSLVCNRLIWRRWSTGMVQKKLFFYPWLAGQSQFFTLVKIDFLAYLVNILITSPMGFFAVLR